MALALILYLVGLGRPPLWEPDEGRYAEIAREMVVSHDYITPHNNFVRYFEKPPLVYWATATSLRIFGHNEYAVRLQAALASVGQVAVTAALGERMFGPITGVLGALALALSPLFFAFARFATPDPALAFFVSAAMGCIYIGSQFSELRSNWMVAASVMLALGTLTKGPVAVVLVGTAVLLWLLFEHSGRKLLNVPWLKCIAVYLVITLPWFILVERRNPGFLSFFVIHEHFHRYLENTEHGWGPWFYVPVTILGTWPWFYFVPLGLSRSGSPFRFSGWISGKTRSTSATTFEENDSERSALSFLVIWFAVVLVFFSVPRSKLGEYILPALPPIAILAGRGLARLDSINVTQRRRILAIFAGINALTAITITLLIVSVRMRSPGNQLSGDALIIAGAILIGGLTPILFKSVGARFVTVALVASVIVAMGAGIDARERIAPFVSYRTLAKTVAPYAERGCRLLSYGHFEQSLPFYTGARETLVNYRGELAPFGPAKDPNGSVFATSSQLKEAWSGDRCIVLILNRLDVPKIANQLYPAPTLIGHEGKKLALSNRSIYPAPEHVRNPIDNTGKES
ncbi:MAG TPA: glycosyltransferase family 39 protein [Candidatus Binataceae bacterium]|nr:glycosyltransferase family 39 protein [Candidatus Binataceae bacterium]